MSPTKQQARREEIARLLDLFSQILIKGQVIQDAGPMFRGAGECRNNRPPGKWGYGVERLLFRNLGSIKAFQKEFDLKNATLELSIRLEGLCENPNGDDPLTLLELNINVSGSYLGSNRQTQDAFCSWHLDRHDLPGIPEFSHPRYHLSFGGKHLERNLGDKDSPVLLINSPRIPHPPLDAILAVDFVLTNFLGNSLCAFRNEPAYLGIVSAMQLALWRPYAESLHGLWQSPTALPLWAPASIWTQLV